MNMRVWAACLGSAMGGVTLALLLARGYPSADPLDRLYGARSGNSSLTTIAPRKLPSSARTAWDRK